MSRSLSTSVLPEKPGEDHLSRSRDHHDILAAGDLNAMPFQRRDCGWAHIVNRDMLTGMTVNARAIRCGDTARKFAMDIRDDHMVANRFAQERYDHDLNELARN